MGCRADRVSSDRVRIRLYRVGVYEKGWPAHQGRVRGILATRGPELIAAHEAGATIPTLAASVGVAPVTPQKYMADLGAALYDDRGRPRKRTI